MLWIGNNPVFESVKGVTLFELGVIDGLALIYRNWNSFGDLYPLGSQFWHRGPIHIFPAVSVSARSGNDTIVEV